MAIEDFVPSLASLEGPAKWVAHEFLSLTRPEKEGDRERPPVPSLMAQAEPRQTGDITEEQWAEAVRQRVTQEGQISRSKLRQEQERGEAWQRAFDLTRELEKPGLPAERKAELYRLIELNLAEWENRLPTRGFGVGAAGVKWEILQRNVPVDALRGEFSADAGNQPLTHPFYDRFLDPVSGEQKIMPSGEPTAMMKEDRTKQAIGILYKHQHDPTSVTETDYRWAQSVWENLPENRSRFFNTWVPLDPAHPEKGGKSVIKRTTPISDFSGGVTGPGYITPDEWANPDELQAEISKWTDLTGVPADLGFRVANQESHGHQLDPKTGGTWVNPKSQAVGTFQVQPYSILENPLYRKLNLADRNENVQAGMFLLGDYLRQYGGDQRKAAAAYDAGPVQLDAALRKAQELGTPDWLQFMKPETRAYVAAVAPGPGAALYVPTGGAAAPTDGARAAARAPVPATGGPAPAGGVAAATPSLPAPAAAAEPQAGAGFKVETVLESGVKPPRTPQLSANKRFEIEQALIPVLDLRNDLDFVLKHPLVMRDLASATRAHLSTVEGVSRALDEMAKRGIGKGISVDEAAVGRKFIRLTEEVNKFRNLYGSTGFRGPQGWEALQKFKGSLLMSPKVTEGLLSDARESADALIDFTNCVLNDEPNCNPSQEHPRKKIISPEIQKLIDEWTAKAKTPPPQTNAPSPRP